MNDLAMYWAEMSKSDAVPITKKLTSSKMLRQMDNKFAVDDWVKDCISDKNVEKRVNQILLKHDEKQIKEVYMGFRNKDPKAKLTKLKF